MKTLKEKRIAVNELYLKAFCKKHHTYYDFVNEDMVLIGDCYFNITDIYYDIDNDVSGNLIWDWYSATLDRAMEDKRTMNFSSWVMGLRYDIIDKKR
jgi:hypothetical protein